MLVERNKVIKTGAAKQLLKSTRCLLHLRAFSIFLISFFYAMRIQHTIDQLTFYFIHATTFGPRETRAMTLALSYHNSV